MLERRRGRRTYLSGHSSAEGGVNKSAGFRRFTLDGFSCLRLSLSDGDPIIPSELRTQVSEWKGA